MFRRILASSRYLILIAVIGSFLTSISILIYAGILSLEVLIRILKEATFTEDGGKRLAIDGIELIDLVLLGTVLYIISLGLYELFIDEHLPTPRWLVISDLDELKAKLLGTIIVLLAVSLLANVVTWNGNANILYLGISVFLVILVLGMTIIRTTKTHTIDDTHEPPTKS